MPSYEGKSQPQPGSSWTNIGSWWNTTPTYEGADSHRPGSVAYETCPSMPVYPPVCPTTPPSVPPDCGQGSRTIAIVIPREITDADPKS